MTSKFIVKKAFKNETKTSRFLITINTQQAFSDAKEFADAKARLRGMLDTIFNDLESYMKVYEDTGKVRRLVKLNRQQLDRVVQSGDIEHHIEVGGKYHRLHSHALVTIEHSPDYAFRMDLEKFRSVLPKGYHLDVKFIRDHAFSLKRYVRKYAAL